MASKVDMLSAAKEAIIRVGEGRGFAVAHEPWPHYVITAAHCLPELPPAHKGSSESDRTYPNLLAPLGESPSVWAQCVFVDPIADLAVLCEPDGQSLYEENEAYGRLMEDRPTLQVGTVDQSFSAWLLMLDGLWQRCDVEIGASGRALSLIDPKGGNDPGTSGSPILNSKGLAIGVINIGSTLNGEPDSKQHGQSRLALELPMWLVNELLDEKGHA
jgi:hypothetical protein